ncbi:hypothetical protein AcV7_002173 [Taiwanofungus camphoratus]|nr:hypothetical protein AcV7_002173 [Antrodia cinnamomea]
MGEQRPSQTIVNPTYSYCLVSEDRLDDDCLRDNSNSKLANHCARSCSCYQKYQLIELSSELLDSTATLPSHIVRWEKLQETSPIAGKAILSQLVSAAWQLLMAKLAKLAKL